MTFEPFDENGKMPFFAQMVNREQKILQELGLDVSTQVMVIPKITDCKRFEQIAQFEYHKKTGNVLYELLWDCDLKKAVLSQDNYALMFPDMTVRKAIHFRFGKNITILGNTSELDMLISHFPLVTLDILPNYFIK